MRAIGRARSHSSSANTGQTINLSPSGSRNGLRPSMAEYGRRSRGCMCFYLSTVEKTAPRTKMGSFCNSRRGMAIGDATISSKVVMRHYFTKVAILPAGH